MSKRVPRQPVAREPLPKAARAAMADRAAARREAERRLVGALGTVEGARVLADLALAFAPTREVMPWLARLEKRLRAVSVSDLDEIGRGLHETVAALDPRGHLFGGLPDASPRLYWRRLVAATAHLAEHVQGMNNLVAKARRELDPKAVDTTAACVRLTGIQGVEAIPEMPTLLALAGIGFGGEAPVRSTSTYEARVEAWDRAWKRHGASSDRRTRRRPKLSDRA